MKTVIFGLTVVGFASGFGNWCNCGFADEANPAGRSPGSGFVRMFDGYTLNGWTAAPAENIHDFSVRDGVLVAEGSKDRLVYLVWKDRPANFEMRLQYRMVTEGNSGVEVRAHVDKSGKRPFEGYHADFGHAGIGPQVLGAWDFHFAKRDEYDCKRGTRLVINEDGSTKSEKIQDGLTTADINKHAWNHLHIVADHRKLSFSINGKVASEFTDNKPEWLKEGIIALQIHDKGMIVEFKDLWIKQLD